MASYMDPSFRESLLKKPHERTAQDLTLINANLKSLEALSSLRDTTIRGLCKTVRFIKHEANDVLYRTGDVINCWYILLSGSVFIDGSMFLPRSAFGRKSSGQVYRIHDCLVLETSEMLVIDYPVLKHATTNQDLTSQLDTTLNTQITTIQVQHQTNTTETDQSELHNRKHQHSHSHQNSHHSQHKQHMNVYQHQHSTTMSSSKINKDANPASTASSFVQNTNLITFKSLANSNSNSPILASNVHSNPNRNVRHINFDSHELNSKVKGLGDEASDVIEKNINLLDEDEEEQEANINEDEEDDENNKLHNMNITEGDLLAEIDERLAQNQRETSGKAVCRINSSSSSSSSHQHSPFKAQQANESNTKKPTHKNQVQDLKIRINDMNLSEYDLSQQINGSTITLDDDLNRSQTGGNWNNPTSTTILQASNSGNKQAKKLSESRSSSMSSSKSSSIISNNNNNNNATNHLSHNHSNLSASNNQINNLSLASTPATNILAGSMHDDVASEHSMQMNKDSVREILEKDPKERSDEDIDVLFEFMQAFPAFSDYTQPIIRKLCACMVLGVVDKSNTVVLDHNEKLDSWAVVLNGHVECVLPNNTVKTYHVGDQFGVEATLDEVYHEGVMKTKSDDCQFVLVKQKDYCDILNQSKENTRSYYEHGKLVMVTEYRLINSGRNGEIVLRGTAHKLLERLINDDANVILDPTYIQDFLLTYRVFIDTPEFISAKLNEWFEQPSAQTTIDSSSHSSTSSLVNSSLKKRVYRIVLEWVTNHFNDFETNKTLYDFVERFQDTLSKEKMLDQFRVLSIALSAKSKPRTVTIARSKRDESLMFNVLGGWDKGYGIFVSRTEPRAAELGIRKGDQILEVNGHSFQHITLANAIDTLKSFTHASVSLKYNPIAFNEVLVHPDKSPHRNKKNFANNRAYLIEYLQQQQNSLANESTGSLKLLNSSNQSPPTPLLSTSSNTLLTQLNNSNGSIGAKKTIGSIPPLPPNTSANHSLTPRNKSKDKFKFLPSSSSNSLISCNSKESNTNQIKKLLGRFNKKSHSKELESLQPSDSSAPALKSITRSPSPSLTNFASTTSFGQPTNSNNSKFNNLSTSTSDYSTLSRNNSSNNVSFNNSDQQQQQQQLMDSNAMMSSSLAKITLHDQQQFVSEHVLKIFKNDQTFKYLVVHKETSTKEVVMLALNEFNIVDEIGSNAYSLCEVSVDQDRVIKQKRLPDQMNNLAEKLALNARYYLKCNTSPEQFLSDSTAVEELIKDANISFLQLDPLELAAQLTLRDYCMFKSIESSEYIDYLFKKSTSKYGIVHLNQFSDLSNEEMFWVINEILHESNIMKRARIIKHFIQIAHVCKECKNYNSLFAILSGLEHLTVTRLKDTWEKVSTKYKKLLDELKELMDPSFNMNKYRHLIKTESTTPPIIPFFPLCQKDLYCIKEQSDTNANGLVNFDKLRKLAKAIRSIVQLAASSYDLTALRDVPTAHTVIFSMFGCTNQSLIEYRSGNQFAKLNIRETHVKKLYEEAVMVRKVRQYLNSMTKSIEKNEERLRVISSTLEHSASSNTLKRKPSPCNSLGGSVSSINALNNSSTSMANTAKPALFGAHSPDAVKKLLALSETKVKTVKNSSSSTSVPLSHIANARNTPNNHSNLTSTSSLSSVSNMQHNQNHNMSTTTISPSVPLSPKSKNRTMSNSQPMNKINVGIPLSSESSSVSTIKLNGKYAIDGSYPPSSSSSTHTSHPATNQTIKTNITALQQQQQADTDSGRASMASNVDQDQCSPTFQQKAYLLNKYIANNEQQAKSAHNRYKQEIMLNNGKSNNQMMSMKKEMTNSQTTSSNHSGEEEDQVSAV